MSYLSAKLNYSFTRNILERERGKEKTEERQLVRYANLISNLKKKTLIEIAISIGHHPVGGI